MTVAADTSVCIGAGLCALRAPAVFDQDEADGTVVLLGQPAPDDLPAVREAVDQCPSGAIAFTDG
ncbi:ferredoxin [Actinokineospora soli]|uniref:Ferredoxin n=1 Tax=Actinokineospora soli TaxID=1048753 RepID=A0ABW2TTW9_9PSEU